MSGCAGRAGRSGDAGSAIVEFVFVAVLVMVPLVYLIVAVATVQRSELAVSQAAREAGRAFATADREQDAPARARAAVHIALRDQGLPDDAEVRFVRPGGACGGPAIVPRLSAGAQFTVCVERHIVLPAVPRFLAGRGITVRGAYLVHVDDFRAAP